MDLLLEDLVTVELKTIEVNQIKSFAVLRRVIHNAPQCGFINQKNYKREQSVIFI